MRGFKEREHRDEREIPSTLCRFIRLNWWRWVNWTKLEVYYAHGHRNTEWRPAHYPGTQICLCLSTGKWMIREVYSFQGVGTQSWGNSVNSENPKCPETNPQALDRRAGHRWVTWENKGQWCVRSQHSCGHISVFFPVSLVFSAGQISVREWKLILFFFDESVRCVKDLSRFPGTYTKQGQRHLGFEISSKASQQLQLSEGGSSSESKQNKMGV